MNGPGGGPPPGHLQAAREKNDSRKVSDESRAATAELGEGSGVGHTGCQVSNPGTFHDPVELALADALQRASVAGVWTVVERLAGELEARRRERLNASGVAPVVTINSARKIKHKAEPGETAPRQPDLFKPGK